MTAYLVVNHLVQGAPVEQSGKLIDAGLLLGLGIELGVLQRHGYLSGQLLQQLYLPLVEGAGLLAGHDKGADNVALSHQGQIDQGAQPRPVEVLPGTELPFFGKVRFDERLPVGDHPPRAGPLHGYPVAYRVARAYLGG